MRHTSLCSYFSPFPLIDEELAIHQHWFPEWLFNITELRWKDNIEMNKYWEITLQTCFLLCRFSAPFRNLVVTWGLCFPVAEPWGGILHVPKCAENLHKRKHVCKVISQYLFISMLSFNLNSVILESQSGNQWWSTANSSSIRGKGEK